MQRAKQVSESIELGIILALVGGFMDVYSYVGRDGVFANAQTGNILLVGVHLSEGDPSLAMRYLLPVLCFSVGIMVSDLVHERFASVMHWRQLTVLAEAVILLGVGLLSSEYNMLANGLTSLACGMQVESFRKVNATPLPPLCAPETCAAARSGCTYGGRPASGTTDTGRQYYGIIVFFIVGAALGAWCSGRWGQRAVLGACVLLLAAFLLMFQRKPLAGTGKGV